MLLQQLRILINDLLCNKHPLHQLHQQSPHSTPGSGKCFAHFSCSGLRGAILPAQRVKQHQATLKTLLYINPWATEVAIVDKECDALPCGKERKI